MTISTVHLFVIFLAVLLNNAVATFKDSCMNFHNAQNRSTYVDGKCLLVDTQQLLSQDGAQQRCLDPAKHQHLAANFDQRKWSHIAAMIDLSNGVWTSLVLNSDNQTVWFNSESGQNSTVANPAWADGFPDSAKGSGILLRFDGLVNAQLDSKHPFLCESVETSPLQVRFKGGRNLKASDSLLSLSTVTNQHKCGISCADDPKCRAYAYSSSKSECQLLWLTEDAMTLDSDSSYTLLNRVPYPESDCQVPSDCLSVAESPKILLVKHGGVVSIESYHPGQSNLNTILHTTTHVKANPKAVLLDGKLVITSHDHGVDADQVPLATETIIYDPVTNTITPGGPAVEARHAPGAAGVNQAVIMCGGISGTGAKLSNCERFKDGHWSLMSASLNVGRWAFEMVNLHNKLYAIGGWDGGFITAVECYDPDSDAWTELPDPLPVPRHTSGVTVFQDQIIVCGGQAGGHTTDCRSYNDVTDQWSPMAAMTKTRAGFSLVAFHGYIYAFGGAAGDGSVEKFDPHTGQWTAESDTIQAAFAAAIVV